MGGSERKVPPIVGVDIPDRPRQVASHQKIQQLGGRSDFVRAS